jgi:phage gp36-like protein
MAYITTTDLEQRLGSTLYARLTDRETGIAVDSNVAAELVAQAEAETDGYLARRYATPVDVSAHPELTQLLQARVLDIAEYRAWLGSPFVSDVPSRVKTLYDESVQWLRGVAMGALDLPAASPPASATGADDGPRLEATERKFTAEELDGL